MAAEIKNGGKCHWVIVSIVNSYTAYIITDMYIWYVCQYLCYSKTYLERPPYWPQKCGLSRQVVSGDRFSYIEMYIFLPKMHGLSRQVVSDGSGGILRQVSLYIC